MNQNREYDSCDSPASQHCQISMHPACKKKALLELKNREHRLVSPDF